MPVMDTNSFGAYPQSAAGHQSILNDINRGQKTKYLNETIWKHRCESVISQISDMSWFGKLDDINCQNELMYKLQPTGIRISSMSSYNQTLKSHTPSQVTQKMQFGEWLYSQMKFSKMEINEKCDHDQFMMDVEEAFRRELDDYIERLAFLRMACISPCWNRDVCDNIQTGSPTAPLLINSKNSHLLPLTADSSNKAQCDNRGHFLTYPKCEMMTLTQNQAVIDLYHGCCTTDVASMNNETPSFGGSTKILYSDKLPYTTCADGSRVYRLTHAPFGSFGYASILSDSETVDSNSMEEHWGKIVRMIVRFGMIVPVPWDYTTYYVKFEKEQLQLATCD